MHLPEPRYDEIKLTYPVKLLLVVLSSPTCIVVGISPGSGVQ